MMFLRTVVVLAALMPALFMVGCSDSGSGDTVVSASSQSLSENGPHGGPPHPGMLLEQLDLTEEQQAAIKEIMDARRDEMHAKMESLRESGELGEEPPEPPDPEAMKAAMLEELAPVLTEAQLAKLEELLDEQAAFMKERFENGGPPPGMPGARMGDPAAMMAEQLGLSEEQQAQIKELFESARENFVPGERPDSATHAQMHEEMKAKLEVILTEEQLTKLEELRPDRPPRPGMENKTI